MKSVAGFFIFVALVVGFLLLFPGKKYPPVPSDGLHKTGQQIADCMACHGKGKQYALKAEHPPKFECFKCHEWPKKA